MRIKSHLNFLLVAILTFVPAVPAFSTPSEVAGRVVYVDDADTIVLLVDGRSQMKIRLSSIDAPETSHTNKERGRIGQPYSNNAGEYLVLRTTLVSTSEPTLAQVEFGDVTRTGLGSTNLVQ